MRGGATAELDLDGGVFDAEVLGEGAVDPGEGLFVVAEMGNGDVQGHELARGAE